MMTVPTILLTRARLSPMTWWARGRVRIVLPTALLEEVGAGELRWVLAHELAHIKRRDHFVRWIEWLACVVAWWNPVVWLARRSMHLDEDSEKRAPIEHPHGRGHGYDDDVVHVHAELRSAGGENADDTHAPRVDADDAAQGALSGK